MRGFRGSDGRDWDVVVGRESWGTVVALFIPKSGPDHPRQALLEVRSADEGGRFLQGLSEQELQDLLATSQEKSTG